MRDEGGVKTPPGRSQVGEGGKELSETRQSPRLNGTRSHVTLRKFRDNRRTAK